MVRKLIVWYILNVEKELVLDEEHSCGEWVSLDELDTEKYQNMDLTLKNILRKC